MSATSPAGAGPLPAVSHAGNMSPGIDPMAKRVTFRLYLTNPFREARLTLGLDILPHDTTDSIIATARNFWGINSTHTQGLSFEDGYGNILIPRYENFFHIMDVIVRVIEEPLGLDNMASHYGTAPQPLQPLDHHVTRPTSRGSRLRSPSPNGGRGRRSTSAGINSAPSKKGRSRSSKYRTQVNGESQGESFNGYSSADGAAGSASGKSKEQLGNTDISVENIVEGGRRKRAKFESSELPLFAPPQMPASTSNPSISPARRTNPYRHSLPSFQPGQNPFSNLQPLPSPQGYTNGYVHPGLYATPTSDHSRSRESVGHSGPRAGLTYPAMTPEPTVGTSTSDEDIAFQLIRLGQPPTQGRASTSTLEDGYSGGADAASSAGTTSNAESDSEGEEPAARRQRLDSFGNHQKSFGTTASRFLAPGASADADASGDEADSEDLEMAPPANTLPALKARQQAAKAKAVKTSKPKSKKATSTTGLISPASLPVTRKPSVVSNPANPLAPGEDEQPDLSTKPRCTRCRKSKKGCDRQRPCGRCSDAGIPACECISEDEGNGRKGRYGRHMGVPVGKREDMPPPATNVLNAALLGASEYLSGTGAGVSDKNKKRKR
ncbi:hypothetical protein N0V88_001060 [Collariella sp. IMI 366227]|nr:hypothetical protein N0V88_001060 [Collariella sp. IMI 366227]